MSSAPNASLAMNGAPMTANNDSRFWDRHAEGYAKRPVADEAAYQHKLKVTREYLRPDMSLLEFGCGTGSTAIVHAPHVKRIHAIDISPKMIEIAQRKTDAAGISNIDYDVATFDDYAAPSNSFDMVLGLSILHLLKDRDEAIAKVRSLLKPGGYFVSSTVCLGDKMSFFKLIAPIGRALGVFPLLRVFTSDELLKSLTDAGFSIEVKWSPAPGKAVFIVAKAPV